MHVLEGVAWLLTPPSGAAHAPTPPVLLRYRTVNAVSLFLSIFCSIAVLLFTTVFAGSTSPLIIFEFSVCIVVNVAGFVLSRVLGLSEIGLLVNVFGMDVLVELFVIVPTLMPSWHSNLVPEVQCLMFALVYGNSILGDAWSVRHIAVVTIVSTIDYVLIFMFLPSDSKQIMHTSFVGMGCLGMATIAIAVLYWTRRRLRSEEEVKSLFLESGFRAVALCEDLFPSSSPLTAVSPSQVLSGPILECNENFKRLFRTTCPVAGTDLSDYLLTHTATRHSDATSTGSGKDLSSSHSPLDGSVEAYFEVLALPRGEAFSSPFHAEVFVIKQTLVDGRHVKAVTIRDMTWRMQSEAAAKQQEVAHKVAEAKMSFFSNVSHELRTPIHGIIGTVQLLRLQLVNTTSSGVLGLLTVLETVATQQLAIVNQILDYAKSDALNEESVRVCLLERVLASVYELYPVAASKGLEIGWYVDPWTRSVSFLSHPDRISQILRNLLTNAIKFTETGGVSVRADRLTASTIRVSVEDTGIGMTEEDCSHIFERFHQVDSSLGRKYQGTGLGLAISRNLSMLFGPGLEVESEVGVGTQFFFDIELKAEHDVAAVDEKQTAATLEALSVFYSNRDGGTGTGRSVSPSSSSTLSSGGSGVGSSGRSSSSIVAREGSGSEATTVASTGSVSSVVSVGRAGSRAGSGGGGGAPTLKPALSSPSLHASRPPAVILLSHAGPVAGGLARLFAELGLTPINVRTYAEAIAALSPLTVGLLDACSVTNAVPISHSTLLSAAGSAMKLSHDKGSEEAFPKEALAVVVACNDAVKRGLCPSLTVAMGSFAWMSVRAALGTFERSAVREHEVMLPPSWEGLHEFVRVCLGSRDSAPSPTASPSQGLAQAPLLPLASPRAHSQVVPLPHLRLPSPQGMVHPASSAKARPAPGLSDLAVGKRHSPRPQGPQEQGGHDEGAEREDSSSISFSSSDSEGPPNHHGSEGPSEPRPSSTILVVDDTDVNRMICRAHLESAGYHVLEACSGQAAIDTCKALGSPSLVHLILMDVQMPEIDGVQATRIIRTLTEFADVPILGVTASMNVGPTCLAAGMTAMLFKPFFANDLVQAVSVYVAAPSIS